MDSLYSFSQQKEQAALRKIEEQKALEEKRQRQQEIAAMYNKSLRLKKEKEARELQEQLAFDMKILEQLLEESRNEAMEQAQRKVRTWPMYNTQIHNGVIGSFPKGTNYDLVRWGFL